MDCPKCDRQEDSDTVTDLEKGLAYGIRRKLLLEEFLETLKAFQRREEMISDGNTWGLEFEWPKDITNVINRVESDIRMYEDSIERIHANIRKKVENE